MRSGRLRYHRLFWFAVACGVSSLAGKDGGWPDRKVIPELTLKNGEVLHNVTLISAGSATAIAKWEDGRGSIPLRLLPDTVREELLRAVAAEQPPKPSPPPPEPATAPTPTPTPTPVAPVAVAALPPAARTSSPPPIVPSPENVVVIENMTYPATSAYPYGMPPGFNPNDYRPVLPENIQLNNGFVMRSSEILRWTNDSITVRYVGGTVPVRLADISAEQRKLFEMRKKGALMRQKNEDEQDALRKAEALKAERARQW